jgi:3-hydroxyisobutyrate dehydrogenase
MSASVAVLGLGIMGSAMVRDAARAGLHVVAWDRKPEVALALSSVGAHAARTLREAVHDVEVVVTMVPDADAVLSLMEGQQAFSAMKAGAAWVQMATIGAEGTDRALRLAATRPEIAFVDAPVSGSKGPAEEGKLVILASGDPGHARNAVSQFFDSIGSRTHWLGEAGQGTRMKLLFNAWMAILNEAVAEVAVLAGSLGTNLEAFASLAQGGPLVPAWALGKLTKIAEDKMREPEFPLRWAHKDVSLALSAAGQQRSRLPVLNEIATVWGKALDQFGADDLSAIYLALQGRAT